MAFNATLTYFNNIVYKIQAIDNIRYERDCPFGILLRVFYSLKWYMHITDMSIKDSFKFCI